MINIYILYQIFLFKYRNATSAVKLVLQLAAVLQTVLPTITSCVLDGSMHSSKRIRKSSVPGIVGWSGKR